MSKYYTALIIMIAFGLLGSTLSIKNIKDEGYLDFKYKKKRSGLFKVIDIIGRIFCLFTDGAGIILLVSIGLIIFGTIGLIYGVF